MKKYKSNRRKILIVLFIICYGCSLQDYLLKIAKKELVPNLVKKSDYLHFDKRIQDLIILDTIIDTHIQIEGFNVFPPGLTEFKNKFFWAVFDTFTSKINLYSYDAERKFLFTDTLEIDSNDLSQIKENLSENNFAKSLDVNDAYLAIRLSFNYILIYKRLSNSNYKYICSFKVNYGNEIFLKNDTLIVIHLQYQSSEKNLPSFGIFFVDLKKLSLIELKTFDFEDLEFLVFYPNKYLSFSPSRNFVLITNPLKPTFKILENFKEKETIVENTDTNPFWVNYQSPYYDTLKKVNNSSFLKTKTRLQPGTFMFKLDKDFKAKEGSKIVFAEFITDSSFIVTYLAGDSRRKKANAFICDIWVKENLNWKKKYEHFADILPDENSKCSKENFYLLSGYFIPKISPKYLANFQISAPGQIMFDTNLTYKKIFSNRDEFISQKGLFWGLYIYKWTKDL